MAMAHMKAKISLVHILAVTQAGGHPAMLPDTVVRECIASRLWTAKDKGSLLAMMWTSREFRLMVSSFIDVVEVEDAASMQPFPKYASVRTLGLRMKLAEAPIWLRAYAASDPDAAGRLQLLEKFRFSMRVLTVGSGFIDPDPEEGPALLKAITQLCPNVRRLMVYLNQEMAINLPLLRSLGTHMPHLTELCLDRGMVGPYLQNDWGSMDWASCFPPCLAKLSMPNSCLPRELIRHLVQLPLLIEVEAYGLEEFPTWMNKDTIEMEACAWQTLRYALSYLNPIEMDCGIIISINDSFVETPGRVSTVIEVHTVLIIVLRDFVRLLVTILCTPPNLVPLPLPCPPRLKDLPHWDTVWPPPLAKLGPVQYEGHAGCFHGLWILDAPSSEQTVVATMTAARLAKCMNADWKGASQSRCRGVMLLYAPAGLLDRPP